MADVTRQETQMQAVRDEFGCDAIDYETATSGDRLRECKDGQCKDCRERFVRLHAIFVRAVPPASDPPRAHSKSEYKRLTTMGVDVLPPLEPPSDEARETDVCGAYDGQCRLPKDHEGYHGSGAPLSAEHERERARLLRGEAP